MERKRKLDTKNLEQCFLGIIMIYIITYLAVVSNIELCIDLDACILEYPVVFRRTVDQ